MIKCKILKNILKKYREGPVLMKQGTISAVHDKDLYSFLESIGEAKRVSKGKAKCYYCHKRITLQNIQCIFPVKNEIKYCCTNSNCYNKLLEGSRIDA